MNVVFGVAFVMAGCGGLWWLEMHAQRKRLVFLQQMSVAMLELHSQIRGQQTPLPRIFLQLSEHLTGEAGGFFLEIYDQLHQGQSFEKSWVKGVNQWFAREEERAVVLQLGRSFSGEEEEICKVLLLADDYFKRILLELQNKLPDKQRSFGAVCFSGGVMLLILLI